jgi:hypothetical protein
MDNKLLLEIANAIMINSQLTNNDGIYDGHTGHCVFLYVFARKYGDKSYETFAEYLLNDITGHLHPNQSIDFQTGLSGIAYGVYYLIRNGYVEGDPDYILGDIDEYIKKNIDNTDNSKSTKVEGYVSPSYYIQYRKDDRKDLHIEENCDCNDLSKLGLFGWLAFIYGIKIRLSFSYTEVKNYAEEMLRNMDATTDLTMRQLVGIGMGLLNDYYIFKEKTTKQ